MASEHLKDEPLDATWALHLQTWTGKDGQKGATKDPIETLYRFATDDCPYLGSQVEEEDAEESDFEEPVKNHY